jgi:hypothetical protein
VTDRTVTVTTVTAALDRFGGAYQRGFELVESAGAPLRSPTYDRRSTGKPESRTPTAAESEVRWRLILATQRLATAIRLLAPHFESFTAWEPKTLARTVDVTWFDRRVITLVDCTPEGLPVWKDPTDCTTPLLSPVEVAEGVDQLRGLLRALSADVDADTIADVLDEANHAVLALRKAGTWAKPKYDAPPKVCSRSGCWRHVEGRRGDVCQPCVQKQYRERKKAS